MHKPCAACGEPVLLLSEAEPPAFSKAWHGECYREHVEKVHADLGLLGARGAIGQSSHDDRVADGLERP